MLPLKKGSTLVVDLSRGAVISGQTNPSEVLKLITRGVEVHSVQNLHAKVFALGAEAVIGSTNVSGHSANTLVEAAVVTDAQHTVAQCRAFVDSLCGELVTPEYARELIKLYNPPKLPGAKKVRGLAHAVTPHHERVWLVSLVYEIWGDEDYEAQKRGRPVAEGRLRSKNRFRIEEFRSEVGALVDNVKIGDLVVRVTKEEQRKRLVSPPARVVHIRRYTKGRSRRGIVFLESAVGIRRQNVRTIIKQMGHIADVLKTDMGSRVLRNRKFVHELLNLWPSVHV